MIESFIGEEEKGHMVCSLDLQSNTGEVVESLINPSITGKCVKSKLTVTQATCFQNPGD